jgi:hypothetical protein
MIDNQLAEAVVNGLGEMMVLTCREWLGLVRREVTLNKEQVDFFVSRVKAATKADHVVIEGLKKGYTCCGTPLVVIQAFQNPPVRGFSRKLLDTRQACSVCARIST